MIVRRLLAVLLLGSALGASAQPQRATAAQWRSDIDFLAAELPRHHPNPFFRTSRADFLARLDAVKSRVDSLSDAEIAILLQQAVASLGDAHTEVDFRVPPNTYFPVRMARFSDGIFVIRTTAAARAACGAKLLAIDGVDADETYARVATLISHENEAWVAARFPVPLVRAQALVALGIAANAGTARFEFSGLSGNDFALDLTAVDGNLLAPVFGRLPADSASPLYRRDPQMNYWFIWDPARHLLYVKYNVCRNDSTRPFSQFARDVFAVADRENVERLVVDLRNNSGGDSSVAQPLIDGLRQRSALRGRLYVIIGRETFSSAMLNAAALRDQAGAIVAGEPSGGKPNGYGEVVSFTLPNSRVPVYTSTKYFQIVAGDPQSIEPDLPVSLASDDFFSSRDPVLDAILPPMAVAPIVNAGRRRAVRPARTCPD